MICNDSVIAKLDWNNSIEVQQGGMEVAKHIKDIWVFIQPINSRYNKSVWENCAKILAEKSDEELCCYCIPLLEWIQDLNWPGATIIVDRLKIFDANLIVGQYSYCVMRAIEQENKMWLIWLSLLIENVELFELLSNEYKELLKKYRKYEDN